MYQKSSVRVTFSLTCNNADLSLLWLVSVALAKFLRILAKPIAGQRESLPELRQLIGFIDPLKSDTGYPIGVYTISRPLTGAPTKVYATVTKPSCRRDRAKGALGMPVTRDAVALALARRMKVRHHRSFLD